MKKRCLLLLFLCALISTIRPHIQHNTNHNPLLVIVLMVKNEAPVIRETLQPYIDAGVDSYLIFDTGSTDDTIEVTKKFFQDHKISQAVIKQEPFVDFATSRNRGLQLAEEAFPHAGFMLMPDAEWYMHNVKELLNHCKTHVNDTHPCYLVRILNPHIDYYTARLIRCRTQTKFVGAVHEVPNHYAQEKVSPETFFEWRTTSLGQEKSRKRWVRDCDLLLKEHERNPQDPRPIFYLAQTYACLGDWENARIWYEKRVATPGWDEENFMAQYRLAQVYEALGNHDRAILEYLTAHELRPHRAEPLVRLAEHFWNTGKKALCFLCAQRAAQLPYPESDRLFIDKKFYELTRYDLLGRAAWYINEYDTGEHAVRNALNYDPDAQYLQNNLKFYTERKKQIAPETPSITHARTFQWVDFTTGMSSNSTRKEYPTTDTPWQAIKTAYEAFIAQTTVNSSTRQKRIPKIIHQIWLGSPFPEKYKQFQEKWKKNHPGWEYRLWTDKDIEAFGLTNQKMYDLTKNYGEKSDIARYEILYRFGGLYIDTDFECLYPFDVLNDNCDFYTGCAQTCGVTCLNGLIGSIPGHPILQTCITNLRREHNASDTPQEILYRTGPQYFTEIMLSALAHNTTSLVNVVFPSDYFYPWPWYLRENNGPEQVKQWIKPYSFAIHHWHASWNDGKTP